MALPSTTNKETNPMLLLMVLIVFIGLMANTFLGTIGGAVGSFDTLCTTSPFFSPICKIGGWVGTAQECFTNPGNCKMDLLKQDITDSIENLKMVFAQTGMSIQAYLTNHCDKAREAFTSASSYAFSFVFGDTSLANKMWGIYEKSFSNLFNVMCANKQINSFESSLYIVSAVLSFTFFFLAIFMTVFMRWLPAVLILVVSYLAAAIAWATALGQMCFERLMEGFGLFLPLWFIGMYVIFTIMFIQTLWFILYICYIKFGQGAKISLPHFADLSDGKSLNIPGWLIVLIIAGIVTIVYMGASMGQNIQSAAFIFAWLFIVFYIAYRFLKKSEYGFTMPTFPSLLMNNIMPIGLAIISLRLESMQNYFAQAGFLNEDVMQQAFANAANQQATINPLLPSTPAALFNPSIWLDQSLFMSVIYVLLFALVMAVVNKEIFMKIIKGEAVHLWSGVLHQSVDTIKGLNQKIMTYTQEQMQIDQRINKLSQEYQKLLSEHNFLSNKLSSTDILLNNEKSKQIKQQLEELNKRAQEILAEKSELENRKGLLAELINDLNIKAKLEQAKLDKEQTERLQNLYDSGNTK